MLVDPTYNLIIMAAKSPADTTPPVRSGRLGFRLDEQSKALIERAARLQRRKVSEFCLVALTDAAHQTIARNETLALSTRDRAAFFDALVSPPEPSERLRRAFAEHASLIMR